MGAVPYAVNRCSEVHHVEHMLQRSISLGWPQISWGFLGQRCVVVGVQGSADIVGLLLGHA